MGQEVLEVQGEEARGLCNREAWEAFRLIQMIQHNTTLEYTPDDVIYKYYIKIKL